MTVAPTAAAPPAPGSGAAFPEPARLTNADLEHHSAGIAAGPPERVAVRIDAPLPLLPTRERRRGSLGIVRCTNKVVTLSREIEELLLNMLPQLERYEGKLRIRRAEKGTELDLEAAVPRGAEK